MNFSVLCLFPAEKKQRRRTMHLTFLRPPGFYFKESRNCLTWVGLFPVSDTGRRDGEFCLTWTVCSWNRWVLDDCIATSNSCQIRLGVDFQNVNLNLAVTVKSFFGSCSIFGNIQEWRSASFVCESPKMKRRYFNWSSIKFCALRHSLLTSCKKSTEDN